MLNDVGCAREKAAEFIVPFVRQHNVAVRKVNPGGTA
jgi:hypothetical protein